MNCGNLVCDVASRGVVNRTATTLSRLKSKITRLVLLLRALRACLFFERRQILRGETVLYLCESLGACYSLSSYPFEMTKSLNNQSSHVILPRSVWLRGILQRSNLRSIMRTRPKRSNPSSESMRMAAKTRSIRSSAFDWIIRYPRPLFAPTHSPIVAPTTLNVTPTFSPERRDGRPAGRRRRVDL